MNLLTGASLLALAKFICYSSIYSTLGTRVFFFECVGMLRFVGRRPTRVRPKADDRNPETAHEKPLAPRVDIYSVYSCFSLID